MTKARPWIVGLVILLVIVAWSPLAVGLLMSMYVIAAVIDVGVVIGLTRPQA